MKVVTAVIGVEPGYRREQDVRIQTELVSPELASRISDNLQDHADNILESIPKLNLGSE